MIKRSSYVSCKSNLEIQLSPTLLTKASYVRFQPKLSKSVKLDDVQALSYLQQEAALFRMSNHDLFEKCARQLLPNLFAQLLLSGTVQPTCAVKWNDGHLVPVS